MAMLDMGTCADVPQFANWFLKSRTGVRNGRVCSKIEVKGLDEQLSLMSVLTLRDAVWAAPGKRGRVAVG
jgi:hypothetical protein